MKKGKVINIIVNVIVIIIAILVLTVAISAISSIKDGYTNFFGSTLVAVQSDSMESSKPESFKKGDLLSVKLLSDAERLTLKKDQIITFKGKVEDEVALITHRIIDVRITKNSAGIVTQIAYITKGDKQAEMGIDEYEFVDSGSVIGVYNGSKAAGLGNFVSFIQSPTGFLVLVVVPSILLVIYAVVKLILVLRGNQKVKLEKQMAEMMRLAAEGTAINPEAERERIRAELIAEMQQGKTAAPSDVQAAEQPAQPEQEEK